VRNGKGSSPRKNTDWHKYGQNYDEIFKKKDKIDVLRPLPTQPK
jgi:hypothetical protein